MKFSSIENMTFLHKFSSVDEKIFTQQAQQFLLKLHQKFNKTRLALLEKRLKRQHEINLGKQFDFLPETAKIREEPIWKVAPTPKDLQKRWVEITGPTDRKMMINALNSGADVFMADFEDANSPTWNNMVEGQANLKEAIAGTLSYTSPEGKEYRLNKERAVLIVRPRGWHLDEKHVVVDNESISASLFDFGLAFFHNAEELIKKGSGPYYYLPKLESHEEARLWNDVFIFSQDHLGISQGTIRATVLCETLPAAFEMEEILYELREHASGLNAGRWDYIFSIIKKFQDNKKLIFPDRGQITMTVPFMEAYSKLLVKTCHKRGAHAMGGMAAFVPNRKNQTITDMALAKVKEDKIRESEEGFDGTWVAHPDLVGIAHDIFAQALENTPHQKNKLQNDINIRASDLLNFEIANGKITEDGLRQNINVTLQYLDAWLRGIGAVAINNLMEDAATAEISRAQLWEWLHREATLDDGKPIMKTFYEQIVEEEIQKIKVLYQGHLEAENKLSVAKQILNSLVLNNDFPEFLTVSAYKHLD